MLPDTGYFLFEHWQCVNVNYIVDIIELHNILYSMN